jgi:Fe(II)/alpha-ketoglutarate-dependent arginine beta-hydroxylase
VMMSSLLGECIGWSTQQGGRVIHDVVPIQGHETEQISSASEQLIWWHTEDAFHPMRGDYLGMLCMRNRDRVPTTFASLERIALDPEEWRLLFEPHYTIRPDDSHRKKSGAGERSASPVDPEEGFSRIEEMEKNPERIALLNGDPSSPYIRIDPYYMDSVANNPLAHRAFESLSRAIDVELGEITLEPGDVCFIDNFKAVHGRRPFKARYDGYDRWLKRITIARDLRKSRAHRSGPASRIIL